MPPFDPRGLLETVDCRGLPPPAPARYPPPVAGFGKRLLRKIGLAPVPTTLAMADMAEGPIVLQGKLRSKERLKSPINDAFCIGYFYKSTKRVPVPQGGFRRLPLVSVFVYPDTLDMEIQGGRVRLRPKQVDSWSREQHLKLEAQGYEDFKAHEKRLWRGRDAIVRGDAKREGDRWVVVFSQMEFPPKAEAPATSGQ